jgi:hypothetical protein
MENKKPVGIKIFGILIILTSLIQIFDLLNFEFYKWLFYPLPEHIIRARYIFSIICRLVGLSAGIGILFHKDLFRKAALLLFSGVLCFAYWKHPYYSVSRTLRTALEASFKRYNISYAISPSQIKTLSIISMFLLYFIDICFAICLIYYFTRPKIKKWFR